jgi:hypothetical protein
VGRIRIPKTVLKQLGARLSRKGLKDANRLLARHLRSDSKIWRQVIGHISRHFTDDAARATANLSHGVFDKAFRSADSLKKLVLEACSKPSRAPHFSTWEGKPRIILEKEFTKVIGHVGKNNEPTTIMRVIIDVTGKPITAFPIPKSQLGKAALGAAAGLVVAGEDGAYAAEPVRLTYAEEIEAHERQYENRVFDRNGGWAGEAVDFAFDFITFGLGGASSTGLEPQEVASRGEVDSRAAEAVQRVEQRLGTKLDPESRQQIYNDVLSIWSYTPVAEPPPKSKPPVSGKGRIHVVKPGETLSRLAEIYYGKTGDWRRIYAANYSQIGNDPNRIKAGAKLVIPI